MAVSVDALQTEVDSIHTRYRRGFVGRTRATRDLSLLDQIITDLRNVVERIPASSPVRATATENLNLYETEHKLIREIQAGGSAVLAGWRLVEWSELDYFRYGRLFAGQNRTTRDNWLLAEMAAEEKQRLDGIAGVASRDAKLAEQRGQMERNYELYTKEVREISSARAGLRAAEHARILANLANRQFALYRTNFSGKARASRRPALLRRMISALESVLASMEAVRSLGINTPVHADNINKVRQQVELYRTELPLIETERGRAGRNVVGMLGDEANQVFAAYRKDFADRSRKSVNAETLSELCEQLHEIARNMEQVEAESPDETNRKNLGIVVDTLKRYEREFQAIVEAQKK